jgi:hypothetical protein
VGGFFGYMDFLNVIADPAHERHEELLEWCGGAFDPADIAESAIRQQMDKLAPKPPRKRTPRASAPG